MPSGVYKHKPLTEIWKKTISEKLKGKIPAGAGWNKGKSLSEKHKLNIGLGNKGKKRTEEQNKKNRERNLGKHLSVDAKKHLSDYNKLIGKKPPTMIGEKNPSWRGGITPINKRIRHTIKYQLWRDAVFSRDNWTCQKCKDRSKKNKRIVIHPHHIKSFAYYPALRFELNNGITLCKECHKLTDNYKKKMPWVARLLRQPNLLKFQTPTSFFLMNSYPLLPTTILPK